MLGSRSIEVGDADLVLTGGVESIRPTTTPEAPSAPTPSFVQHATFEVTPDGLVVRGAFGLSLAELRSRTGLTLR
ncbi:MAG: hypothetical protein AB7I40_21000 [Nocardioides sp.]